MEGSCVCVCVVKLETLNSSRLCTSSPGPVMLVLKLTRKRTVRVSKISIVRWFSPRRSVWILGVFTVLLEAAGGRVWSTRSTATILG